ncbi:MAG TPA: cyclic nucleotide-binding domain-containing protein [Ghiorsea sp.]|nr:cyclic nucleotide-binding domain-containing protein [Ghiorsea sp.]
MPALLETLKSAYLMGDDDVMFKKPQIKSWRKLRISMNKRNEYKYVSIQGLNWIFTKYVSMMCSMALNEEELAYAYHGLLHAFPEDLHIARPMIQMLQDRGDNKAARELAMEMARRMLALGYSTYALAFITICEQLKHPNKDEINSIRTMAELTLTATHQDDDVKMFELIETLSDAEAKDFLKQGTLLTVQAGESIVKQGEVSRNFYLILDGTMRVHVETRSGQDIDLTELKKGEFFGEFASVYHLPRTATVTASTEVTVLEFEDTVITELLDVSPEAGDSLIGIVQRRMVVSVSHSHPLFANIEDADRVWLGEEALLKEFEPGQSLLEEGHLNYFYIIAFGRAIASRDVGGKNLSCEMGVHALFGNESALLALPEGTTLVASERCLVCKVPLAIFEAFSKAYGGFEHWTEKHVSARNQTLGGE